MERHGKDDGSAKKWVLSWGHDEERLVLRNGVQSVEHFDGDLNFEFTDENGWKNLTKTERAMVIG